MVSSLSKAVISILGAKTYILLIGFFFTPALVRLLGPTLYGQYAVIMAVSALFVVLMSSGTADAVRKYIAEREDEQWHGAIFGYVFRPAFVLGIAFALGSILAARSGLAAAVFGPPYTSLFYVLGGYIIVRQLNAQIISTLMGLRLESKSEPLKMIDKTLYVILALVFVYYGLGVEGVLYAFIISNTVIAIIGLLLLGRQLSLRSVVSLPDVSIPKHQINVYTGYTVFFFLFLTSLYHVDVLLLQLFSTDEIVGYYKGALQIAEVLWFAPVAVQLALLQRTSHLWERGDIEAIQRRASLVTRYVFLFTALVVVGMAALASDFVRLYLGADFSPAVVPLLLLLPGVLGFATIRPSLAINQARRSLRPLIITTGACSAVNLVLNLLLIPIYGMIGAAVATSIGYASLVVFQSALARNLGYRPLAGIEPIPSAVTIGITAAIIVPTAIVIGSPLLSLIVVPPLGAVTFFTTAVVTGAITNDDVNALFDELDVFPTAVERQISTAVDRIPRML